MRANTTIQGDASPNARLNEGPHIAGKRRIVGAMRRLAALVLSALTAFAVLASGAQAHEERSSTWPTYPASVPQYRSTGPSAVVCKPDSRVRILHHTRGATRRLNLRLLKRCRFRDIQRAVNKARNGTRILVLPGVYRELPSRRKPLDDPRCAAMTTTSGDGSSVPSYAYQLNCPNAKNLIAILGDRNGDRRCDSKCRIQITGTARPRDVVIAGDGKKLNVIRADRADGVYLGNFTIEYSDFNNIYALETAGFHFSHIVTRWSREYGILTFTSEAGLYEHVDAYGAGDSGIYPGSGPQGRPTEAACQSPSERATHTYGIEIRNVASHDNNLGYSGTSGDSVYTHDSSFHDNATGIATDSFAAGHPGAPEHCSQWTRNSIYSNNFNIFTPEHRAYCRKPKSQRLLHVVCSSFQVPVGTGALIAGGNGNIVRDNYIYDNWRSGWRLFFVPAYFRGENDPAKQNDTSYDNTFTGNQMGVTRRGQVRPNGEDFWWDGEGRGNCWAHNQAPPGRQIRSNPASLPTDCGGGLFTPGDPMRISSQATCATWDPSQDPPPGCDWADLPPRPR